MKFVSKLYLVLTVIVVITINSTASETPQKPLSQSELMALVAGDALSENIIIEIRQRSLNFRASTEYQGLLRKAGASESLLHTVDESKGSPDATAPNKLDSDLLRHLSRAGELIRAANYSEATRELNEALSASLDGPEAPFVMGHLLRKQDECTKAAMVYGELQHRNPNFPQVDTKLAYIYYRLGDQESAIRSGRAALERHSEDAEAHKNLGLAFDAESKPDASIAEFAKPSV